jgi:hypothetical protein
VNETATSLERLHDVALPDPVPWWPPAPGWYLVATALVLLLGLIAWRRWRRWRAVAYRREALRALAAARDAAGIAEVLRRTALAVAPRTEIAALGGTSWPDWLANRCPRPMPAAVRTQLARGVYGRGEAPAEVAALREYAALWIAQHAAAPPGSGGNGSGRGPE